MYDGSAYLVSGKPYITGSFSVAGSSVGDPTKIEFPFVTRWIYVVNRDSGTDKLKIAFTEAGLAADAGHFFIDQGDSTGVLELKTNEIWLQCNTPGGTISATDVVAGLTVIPSSSLL